MQNEQFPSVPPEGILIFPTKEKPVDETQKHAALFAALAKAQGQMKNPERNRTVTVRSDKGSYTFDYATLDNIIDTCRKALSDNGLALSQALERDDHGVSVLVTRVMHSAGGVLVNYMPVNLPQPDERGRPPRIQEIGSVITYARRYALCAMLNVAAEEDDDGAAGEQRDTKARAPAAKTVDGKDDARSAFKRIRAAITECTDAMSLAKILLTEKDALMEIKRTSEAAYSEIMKLKTDKETAFGAGA